MERRYRVHGFEVYACRGCTVLFREPLPREHELVAMYEDPRYHAIPYFQDVEPKSGRPEIRIYERALADLATLVQTDRRTLLDVGCGSGVFLYLARRAGWDVRGVEFSETHAAQARERLALDVWQGDFLAAPLAEGAFDVVTMWDFLEHVLDPRAVLAKCRRLLAPGGVALVFTIDSTSLFNETGALLHRLSGDRALRVLKLLYDFRHNYYFTRPSLTRLIETSGFRIERWRADRAHLGRWLAEPAPWYVFAGGLALDVVSFMVGRPYRRTAFCRRLDD